MKKIIFIVIIIIFSLFLGVSVFVIKNNEELQLVYNYWTNQSKAEKLIKASRPKEATYVPDFSKEVTDIRITVREREAGCYRAELLPLIDLQIYYGYYSNGEWHDIPCENYDLKPIIWNYTKRGWKIADASHVVKIGPFLLLAIVHDRGEKEVYDNLGTEVLEPFDEYITYNKEHFIVDGDHVTYVYENVHGYSFFCENREAIINGDVEYYFNENFYKRSYLILDYDSLPDDYVLTCGTWNVTKAEIVQFMNE